MDEHTTTAVPYTHQPLRNLNELLAMQVFWQKAKEQGDDDVQMSCRMLAEDIGVTYPTASRIISRLIKKGYLARVQDARSSLNTTTGDFTSSGSVYRILVPSPESQSATTRNFQLPPPSTGIVVAKRDFPDAFKGKGLSKRCLFLWMALAQSKGVHAHTLVGPFGSRSTVYKTLSTLQHYGMARSTPQGWVAVPVDLVELAETLNTAGWTERQRERHAQDRENLVVWHAWKKTGTKLTQEEPHAASQAATGIPAGAVRQEGPSSGSSDAIQRDHAQGVRLQPERGVGEPVDTPRGTRAGGQNLGGQAEGEAVTAAARFSAKYDITNRVAVCPQGHRVQLSASDLQGYRCAKCKGALTWLEGVRVA